MIDPRAIERTLAEGIDVRMLFDHDPGRPLGRLSAGTLKLIPTSRSLNFEVEPPEHEAGVMASVERRDIDGASFGFVVLRDEWTMANGQARRLASRLPPVVPIIRGSAREGPPAAGALQINRLEQRPRPAALVVRVGPCRSGARCTASAQSLCASLDDALAAGPERELPERVRQLVENDWPRYFDRLANELLHEGAHARRRPPHDRHSA